MKRKEHTTPDGYLSVTATQTIQWNYGGQTHYEKGKSYELPESLWFALKRYFTLNSEDLITKENDNGE
jgi:hypothetical protein